MCQNRNSTKVKLCKPNLHSGKKEVYVDECIAPLIQMLNNYSVRTIGCCCGHGKWASSVFIENQHTKTIFEMYTATPVTRKKKFYSKLKDGYYKPYLNILKIKGVNI